MINRRRMLLCIVVVMGCNTGTGVAPSDASMQDERAVEPPDGGTTSTDAGTCVFGASKFGRCSFQ